MTVDNQENLIVNIGGHTKLFNKQFVKDALKAHLIEEENKKLTFCANYNRDNVNTTWNKENTIQEKVTAWAEAKDLLKSENKYQQLVKVMEELGELSKAILKNDVVQQIDGLGDVQVTLIILSKQLGLDYDKCLEAAWEEIKDRKGKTVGGTFIKNEQ